MSMDYEHPHRPIGIEGRLARIETKLDSLLEQEADKEQRIRQLERRDAVVVALAGVLSLGTPLILKLVFKL